MGSVSANLVKACKVPKSDFEKEGFEFLDAEQPGVVNGDANREIEADNCCSGRNVGLDSIQEPEVIADESSGACAL